MSTTFSSIVWAFATPQARLSTAPELLSTHEWCQGTTAPHRNHRPREAASRGELGPCLKPVQPLSSSRLSSLRLSQLVSPRQRAIPSV